MFVVLGLLIKRCNNIVVSVLEINIIPLPDTKNRKMEIPPVKLNFQWSQ